MIPVTEIVGKLRDIDPGDCWPCHVGSGECKSPAVEAHDDGQGGEFLVCRDHLPGVYAFAKLVYDLSDAEREKLSEAIKQHE